MVGIVHSSMVGQYQFLQQLFLAARLEISEHALQRQDIRYFHACASGALFAYRHLRIDPAYISVGPTVHYIHAAMAAIEKHQGRQFR